MATPKNALIFGLTNAWLYLKHFKTVRRFRRGRGFWPNVANPRRYSEWMLWRKLVDRNPQFGVFCDKLAAKEFMKNRCPDLPLAPTLWIGYDVEQIPAGLLKGDVFVKANHGCDYNFCIRDGQFDRAALLAQSRRWLSSIYGVKDAEWGYSQVKPKLFVETSVGDAKKDLLEFQIRISNGRAILGSVMGHSKMPEQWHAYLDPQGKPALGMGDPEGTIPVASARVAPAIAPYLRAVDYAQRLSAGVDYVRFDFLWNGHELYGGEITVYPAGGSSDPANSTTHALMLSSWNFRQTHFLKSRHTGWMGCYARALDRQLPPRPMKTVPPSK